jgi:hypothetical protein
MRHVYSKGNARTTLGKDVSPHCAGKKQLDAILSDFGEFILQDDDRRLFLRNKNWEYQTSNLKRAQLTGLMARQSLINKAKELVSTKKVTLTKIKSKPFVIKQVFQEISDNPDPSNEPKLQRTWFNMVASATGGGNILGRTFQEYFNGYLNKASATGAVYFDPALTYEPTSDSDWRTSTLLTTLKYEPLEAYKRYLFPQCSAGPDGCRLNGQQRVECRDIACHCVRGRLREDGTCDGGCVSPQGRTCGTTRSSCTDNEKIMTQEAFGYYLRTVIGKFDMLMIFGHSNFFKEFAEKYLGDGEGQSYKTTKLMNGEMVEVTITYGEPIKITSIKPLFTFKTDGHLPFEPTSNTDSTLEYKCICTRESWPKNTACSIDAGDPVENNCLPIEGDCKWETL